MKNKILTFVIGILVGAILALFSIYFYTKNLNSVNMPGGMSKPMQNMQMPQNMNGNPPPEMPGTQS